LAISIVQLSGSLGQALCLGGSLVIFTEGGTSSVNFDERSSPRPSFAEFAVIVMRAWQRSAPGTASSMSWRKSSISSSRNPLTTAKCDWAVMSAGGKGCMRHTLVCPPASPFTLKLTSAAPSQFMSTSIV
jgi:hypothetical protein